jgi:hypothetical protein
MNEKDEDKEGITARKEGTKSHKSMEAKANEMERRKSKNRGKKSR